MIDRCICPRCWGTALEPGAGSPCTYCQGAGDVEDQLLSPHFRFSEWACGPKRHAIPNGPDTGAIDLGRETATSLLEPLRSDCGPLLVTSGYRVPQLDVIADHNNTWWLTHPSGHAIGSAWDVQPLRAALTIRDLAVWFWGKRGVFAWDQVILEFGCCHVAARCPGSLKQRGQMFARVHDSTKPTGYGYDPYDPGSADQARRIA